jgi:hypothetical protein
MRYAKGYYLMSRPFRREVIIKGSVPIRKSSIHVSYEHQIQQITRHASRPNQAKSHSKWLCSGDIASL